jgi:hypothetical protein
MAELADAADSKSAEGNLVGVRPPLPAPNRTNKLLLSHFPNRPPNAQTMLELEKFVFGRTIDRRDRGAVVAKTVGYERLYPHEPGMPSQYSSCHHR